MRLPAHARHRCLTPASRLLSLYLVRKRGRVGSRDALPFDRCAHVRMCACARETERRDLRAWKADVASSSTASGCGAPTQPRRNTLPQRASHQPMPSRKADHVPPNTKRFWWEGIGACHDMTPIAASLVCLLSIVPLKLTAQWRGGPCLLPPPPVARGARAGAEERPSRGPRKRAF